MSRASAYLFSNGNAMFFDERGEQIPKMQKFGLCGLHDFVVFYPDAPIYWAVWRQGNYPIHPDSIPWLLRCLRKWPGPKPKNKGGG